jgi:hypothetical protein
VIHRLQVQRSRQTSVKSPAYSRPVPPQDSAKACQDSKRQGPQVIREPDGGCACSGDSGSTDGTLDICARHGCRVGHRDWTGYVDQKAHGLSLCSRPWILNLDADEEVSPELREEIQAILLAIAKSIMVKKNMPQELEWYTGVFSITNISQAATVIMLTDLTELLIR